MNEILIGYNAEFLERGIYVPVYWSYKKQAMGIIVGATGTGKTMCLSGILGKIGKYCDKAKITLCDFKADDFRYLKGCKNYYQFTDCKKGLEQFYAEFQAMQGAEDNPQLRQPQFLIFEEWASFLNNCSRAENEQYKNTMQTILMLGRSRNFHVLVSQQRGDSSYFATARDNFTMCIMLGNLSKESRAMFGIDKDDIKPVHQICAGYVLFNGVDLVPLQVGNITDVETMRHYIKIAVDR